MQRNKKTAHLVWAALIAALYVALTWVTAQLGLASGIIQFRLSEAMCILSVFTPAAIPGLTLGCLISNLLTACHPMDILFGSLATLIGAVGGYLLRKLPYLAPLPTVLANAIIVPFVLKFAYELEGGLAYFALTVGIGEVVCAYIGGILLYQALKPHKNKLFL